MNKPKSMIIGSGMFAPKKVLSNHDLEKIVDTSDEWIRSRTGIERRHILEEGLTNSDMAAAAGKAAIDNAGLGIGDIDIIIVATITPDSIFPATSCRVQDLLGAENAAVFDISAACSGFIYGLILGESLLVNGHANNVLVIGSEVLSRFTDWEDRKTCVLFGDGAGAVVLTRSDGEKGILSSFMKSDGRLGHLLSLPGCGSTNPVTHLMVDQRLQYIKMEGREVFKHAVRTMVDAATHGLEKAGATSEDVDILITHQANIRIIKAVAERLNLPEEKVFVNLQEYGNTSAASIPIALNQALNEGRVKPGDKCLLVAFGGGFTWAASFIQF